MSPIFLTLLQLHEHSPTKETSPNFSFNEFWRLLSHLEDST